MRLDLILIFHDSNVVYEVGSSAPHPPTWKITVSLLVWVITFDLSGIRGPTSSYTTADIAVWVV